MQPIESQLIEMKYLSKSVFILVFDFKCEIQLYLNRSSTYHPPVLLDEVS